MTDLDGQLDHVLHLFNCLFLLGNDSASGVVCHPWRILGERDFSSCLSNGMDGDTSDDVLVLSVSCSMFLMFSFSTCAG